MRWKARAFVLVSAAGASLVSTATATADLALVAKQHESTGYSLLGNDVSTDRNEILVTYDPATPQWSISDKAGIAALATECTRVSATQAQCPASAFQILKFEVGPGSDEVRAVGDYADAGPPNRFLPLAVALGGGPDRFFGGEGAQLAIGGPGNDRLFGGPRFDDLVGGKGRDRLFGGSGGDFLRGGTQNDVLSAGPGRGDLMVAGKGKDRCTGEPKDRVGGSCEKVVAR